MNMTSAQLRNAGSYVLIALAAAVVVTGVQLGVVLAGAGAIEIRPLAATFVSTLFGALMTAGGAAFRPKAGREDISGLVSDVGSGPAKAALEGEAVRQATGAPFTPDQLAQVLDGLEQRMRVTPSRAESSDPAGADTLISKAPTWLPAEGRG